MNKRTDPFLSLLREQSLLLAVIAVIAFTWFAQKLGPVGWDAPFLAAPSEIIDSWRHLCAGSARSADYRQFGTLISYAFLHSDANHLLLNMFYLWIFAALIVESLGKRWFALIFLASAIGGGIGHTLLYPLNPTLGASGVVMGFEGAYLGLALTRQLPDPQIWPIEHPIQPLELAGVAVIGIAIDFYDASSGIVDLISHGSHIGGFVVGFFITSIALPALTYTAK